MPLQRFAFRWVEKAHSDIHPEYTHVKNKIQGTTDGNCPSYSQLFLLTQVSIREIVTHDMNTNKVERINVPLDNKLYKQIVKLAEEDRRPLGTFVRVVLEKYVEEQNGNKKEK